MHALIGAVVTGASEGEGGELIVVLGFATHGYTFYNSGSVRFVGCLSVNHFGEWHTASILLPSGSRTKAP